LRGLVAKHHTVRDIFELEHAARNVERRDASGEAATPHDASEPIVNVSQRTRHCPEGAQRVPAVLCLVIAPSLVFQNC
jgi:hypothetical protein